MVDRRADDLSSSPGAELGGDESREEGLSPAELDAEGGAPLPDREAMSLISANVDIPANPTIAADVLAGELEGLEPAEDVEEDAG